MRRLVLGFVAVAASAWGAWPALAIHDTAEREALLHYERALRPVPTYCEDPRVLAHILERFAWAERNTWHRGFVMTAIEAPHERYNVFHAPNLIRHRHCIARAHFSHGWSAPLYYTVELGMGLASIGGGVSFCIPGLDPWRVHGAHCSTDPGSDSNCGANWKAAFVGLWGKTIHGLPYSCAACCLDRVNRMGDQRARKGLSSGQCIGGPAG
jgi:hypothetical protein